VVELLVSVVIPVHDGEHYLGEAIRSVTGQSHPEIEVIVVDDGSTDDSRVIAEAFGPPIRPVAQRRAGAGAARNRGAELARGAYLAFLDADDLWTPSKIERELEEFRRDPDLEMVFGHVRQFHSPELGPAAASRLACPPELQPGLVPGTMLIRREAFERVGGFDIDVRAGEAMHWLLCARELRVREVLIPDLVLWRRVHATNHSATDRDGLSDYARVLKASIDRRRARHPA
jgi:glycosyltransferase involved in cell wall biosynthesis